MLMCSETVTLVRLHKGDDGETYTCTAIAEVSWHGKAVTESTTAGAQPKNQYKCRLPAERMPAGITPHKGDYLIRGELGAVTRAPQDFADREYFTITAVGDNRRGKNQHWAVSGA